MIAVISPAKRLDYQTDVQTDQYSIPDSLDASEKVIKKLRTLSRKKIGDLMKINPELAELNHQRYQDWSTQMDPIASRQAVFAFKGDAFLGMDPYSFNEKEIKYAQGHLRILSGLHGVLRPLDLIHPYRLEMGTRLPVLRKKNLVDYWTEDVTSRLKNAIAESGNGHLINLASKEYFSVINTADLDVEIITPNFLHKKNGEYKFLHGLGKKARGMMVRYMVKNQLKKAEDLKGFDLEGYKFNSKMSEGNEWVFTKTLTS